MALEALPIPLTWTLLPVLAVLFYLYAVRPLFIFRKMGVPGPTPLPVIGTTYLTAFWGFYNNNISVSDVGPVKGFFNGMTPALVISDAEMMKEIFVKQFHKFTSRQTDAQMINVKPLSRMVFQLLDDDWKNVRTTISPAFSSSKLRQMTGAMNSCADQLVENISSFATTKESFDVRQLTGAFTMDVIARTIFGTEINSQRNPQDPFAINAKKSSNINFNSPLIWLYLLFPGTMKRICEFLDYQLFFPREATDFFNGVMDQLLSMRETDGGKGRVDMLQIMIDAHKEKEDSTDGAKVHGKKQPLTRDDVVANGIGFFNAGYDTVSITLSFLLYHLALDQQIQDKVRQEIYDVTDGESQVDYEAVQKMSYLEMCVMETLRLYSLVPFLVRVAAEDVQLKDLTIPKGMGVSVPVVAIHYDPARWTDPRKFIPERFTKAEREKRNPYDWLPFEAGPRNCVGMRLALMELKVGVAKILMKYRVTTGPDTVVPVKLSKWQQFPTPENPIRLMVEPVD
ncbi:cytochrome P450 3A21-like [Branchiostoma floridae]|uniref:Cytochrome P450 3A21-like n=1 Tax=Branchiostoma floridae TaxID=7739 RepID=A0A9J7HN48_BRAFL|nr:cytochrome P450 3A21-like [Branchiostoma floridae]